MYKEKNQNDFQELDSKQKEELKKYQKYIEEKAGMIHSLEKKLQKLEDSHIKTLAELENKKDELSETLGVKTLKMIFF